MGKCCVAGCGALVIDYARERFSVETPGGVTHTVNLGDTISIDGTSGEVLLGAVPLVEPSLPDEYRRLMSWADSRRRLGVRANADTPEDAAGARAFGAEGIGLCRTEHMFFGDDRILAVRRMILAADEAGRRAALDQILPMQREDFVGILRAMAGFCPSPSACSTRRCTSSCRRARPKSPRSRTSARHRRLAEIRCAAPRRSSTSSTRCSATAACGWRSAIPEIYEVQARAILEAACRAGRRGRPGRCPRS